jgi:hypothetical protein
MMAHIGQIYSSFLEKRLAASTGAHQRVGMRQLGSGGLVCTDLPHADYVSAGRDVPSAGGNCSGSVQCS